ncbi:MAG: site-specific integrase [Nitrososphaerales archaeon]
MNHPINGTEPKEEESIERLRASGKLAPQTKRNYEFRIMAYLRRVGKSPDGFVTDVKRHPKKFEEDFIRFLQETSRKSAPSTTAFFRDSLKRFLELNRVNNVDWNYINQFLPKVKKSGQDRAPTTEEIRKIVEIADLRMKCLVLFLCSSGARIGTVEYLRWKDIEEIEAENQKFAKVIGYRGEPEEYTTFITPECHWHLLQYKGLRESIGERVTPSSFVFVTEPNKRDFDQRNVKGVSVKTLKNQLGELLNQIGMRSVIVEKENYRSYEFKQAHGFRKFFKTRMEVVGVKTTYIETMMEHSTGVQKSYFKPTAAELAKEYAKAIDELTIMKSKETTSQQTILATFNRQYLVMAGYSEEEVERMGDLSQFTPQQVQELVKQKQMDTLGLNGNHQKVVAMRDVEGMVTQGWDFVTPLPDDRAIVRLPTQP